MIRVKDRAGTVLGVTHEHTVIVVDYLDADVELVRIINSELGAAYRNRTDDLRITSASLWPTELRRRAVLADGAP